MSVKVRIPVPLRRIVGGVREVHAQGDTVEGVIKNLDQEYPGFGERILSEGGELTRFVNVYINGEDIRFREGIATRLEEDDEISIVPAIAGG
jgi:molybdopterin synthase sulfur carrier subunit